VRIKQWTTGIPRIDRGISLNCSFNQTAIARPDGTLQTTYDSGCQSSIQTERITNRQDLLTHGESFRSSHRYGSQRLARQLNQFDDRQMGIRVTPDNFSGVVLLTTETDRQFLRSLDRKSVV